MVRLLRRRCIQDELIEYCAFGTPWRKSTRLVGFLIDLAFCRQRRCTGRACRFTGEKHLVLSGTNEAGIFRTKVAEPYPAGLCRLLALAFSNEHAQARARQLELLMVRRGHDNK